MGSVWTTVFPQNVSKIQSLLNLPEHVIPFSFMPIGYPAEKNKKIMRAVHIAGAGLNRALRDLEIDFDNSAAWDDGDINGPGLAGG